jgi:asparagine synthetase B (glutamine-hydrolysing)
MGKQVKHRGPDWSGNHIANNTILVHERLSIVGVGKKYILSRTTATNLKRAH